MANVFDQVTAITNNMIIPKTIDNIFATNKVIKRFTRPEFMELSDGGVKIQVPIINDSSTPGGMYDGRSDVDISASDNITAALYDWKYAHEPVRIYTSEIRKNSGVYAILSLVKQKAKIAEKSMKETLASGIFSAGTGLNITGLQAIMSATSTLGGLAVADNASWIAQLDANSGTDRPITLPLLSANIGSATQDEDAPTALYMKQNVHDQVNALFLPTQKIVNEEMGKLGFSGVLEYEGRPLIIDSHMVDGAIYGVDEKNVYLTVHKDENMRKDVKSSLDNSNSSLTNIWWMGNLVCASRRTNFSLSSIATS